MTTTKTTATTNKAQPQDHSGRNLATTLERTAANMSSLDETTDADITRWQKLFGYSSQEARKQIKSFRSDLDRTSISNELWSRFAAEQEELGFDRESFEFSLRSYRLQQLSKPAISDISNNDRGSYIITLEGPLDSIESVWSILDTRHPPKKLFDSNKDSNTVFCTVTARERNDLLQHLSKRHPSFQLTSRKLAKAVKNLGTHSRAPALGRLEWTLPHLRPSEDVAQRPAQDEYPVWYFFYEELADPQILRSLLALADDPVLVPATIRGGKIRTWGGKYKALLDATEDDCVAGSAYQVMTQEPEEMLQFFETDAYEVVRCSIAMAECTVDGLVFRYCGAEDQLSRKCNVL